jgi:hypothetical protein
MVEMVIILLIDITDHIQMYLCLSQVRAEIINTLCSCHFCVKGLWKRIFWHVILVCQITLYETVFRHFQHYFLVLGFPLTKKLTVTITLPLFWRVMKWWMLVNLRKIKGEIWDLFNILLLSPLKLWVSFQLMARCARYNMMWMALRKGYKCMHYSENNENNLVWHYL